VSPLTHQLRALGLSSGQLVVVHTSFRAVRAGRCEGPLDLIHALIDVLGDGGTLVMPTMTAGDAPFDPVHTPTLDMGITAETFRGLPDVLRSTHPGASFAARGPLARHICAPQPLCPPHGPDSPIGRVWQHKGQVLLIGVGHSANTTLHLAEALAGVPYWLAHPCVVGTQTRLLPETDHCCEGFHRIDPLVDRLGQRKGPVGGALARMVSATSVVDAALELLDADPFAFVCPPGHPCGECDRARANAHRSPPVVPVVRV